MTQLGAAQICPASTLSTGRFIQHLLFLQLLSEDIVERQVTLVDSHPSPCGALPLLRHMLI
jgi:hypothetical protein